MKRYHLKSTDVLDINVVVILALMLSVAGFTMISGLLIIILERTNMIGILKALGQNNNSIRKIFLYVSFFLIGKGMLWGNMLKLLSGRQHKVITSCCTVKNGVAKSFSNVTLVEFFELSDLEIEEYIATGEPFDKAGAYGIQGKGSLLVKKIDGDYFNVVGLPVSELNRILKKEYSYE